jgi:hypothetical protein
MSPADSPQILPPAGSLPASSPAGATRLSRFARLDPGLIVVGVLVLIAVSPLFQPGLPNVADAPIHLFRTAEWVRSWRAGILLPRWAPTLAYGYGYPLFVFAPPLPYMLAGILHLAGFSLETAIKLLSTACFFVAGYGMYALARTFFGSAAAVLAAGAYVFAPFFLREAYLYGGNYPQLLAIALFPAVLWAFHRLAATGRTAHLLLAAALYGAVILSHNFQALVLTPLLGLYVLGEAFLTAPQQPIRRLLRASAAAILGLGWTAFFWLPALVERQWTRAQEQIYVAVSPFYLRFLDLRDLVAPPAALDASAANPAVPFTLGPVILALAGVGVVAALIRARRRWPAALFLLALLLVAFMGSPSSEWLWANLPWLALAEFPWRLMGLGVLCCAFLAGAGFTLWPRARRAWILPIAALPLVILGSAVYLYPPKPFIRYGPTGTPSLADQIRYERATGTIGSTTLGEYLSIWVREVPSTSPLVPEMLAGRSVEKLDRTTLPSGVEARLLAHTPNLDRYAISAEQPFAASFLTFYFPGWRASIDGQPAEIEITEPYGLIQVPVPAGQHELTLRFGETPLRLAADWLSLLALGAVVALIVVDRSKARRPAPPAQKPLSMTGAPFAVSLVVLLVLFLAKIALIDPATTWFRSQSPPGEVIGVSHPARVNLDDRVLFLGYDLDRDVVQAGGRVRLTLYWQALQKLGENYHVFVHLDAPPYGTTFLAADNDPPGDAQAQIDIPTTRWEMESYVRDEHRFVVPADLPALRYTLQAGLYDPSTGESLGEAIPLQEIQVLPAHPIRASAVPNPLQVRLGEQIELLGYELEPGPTLALYWRAREPVGQNYTIFVHAVDRDGALLDQRDGPPLEGMYPTSDWWPGQIVVDRRQIVLPAGTDRLLVGLYELASGKRLPAYGGDGQRLADDAIALPVEP